jgi:hypothetical protein
MSIDLRSPYISPRGDRALQKYGYNPHLNVHHVTYSFLLVRLHQLHHLHNYTRGNQGQACSALSLAIDEVM